MQDLCAVLHNYVVKVSAKMITRRSRRPSSIGRAVVL
jgi:hypothetical protein